MMVRPVPLMLPPVQFRAVLMVMSPVPLSVPPERFTVPKVVAALNTRFALAIVSGEVTLKLFVKVKVPMLKLTLPAPLSPPPLNKNVSFRLSVVVAGTLIVVLVPPPPFKLSVPPVRLSVPVLLKAMVIASVFGPVLVNVPALLNAGATQQLLAITPPPAVKVAPARLLNTALAELNNQELTPLIVATPLLSSARERDVESLAVTAIVAPAAMMVRPVPLMLPPVQFRAVLMVMLPVPLSVPLERVSRAMLTAALAVAAPLLMTAVSRAVGTPAGAQLAAVNQLPLLPVQVRVV